MIKQYFKQALSQLKQQPLLTTISVLGTALTICLIMVVVMQQQIKTVPFAPETLVTRQTDECRQQNLE